MFEHILLDENSCSNNGQCVQEGDGLPECKCDPGYKGEMCQDEMTCEDIDVCLNGGLCSNSSDSYNLYNVTCDCPVGTRFVLRVSVRIESVLKSVLTNF